MAAQAEVELVYDGLGRCVKRTNRHQEATIIIYDDWQAIAEWDRWTADYFQAWNVYGPGADEILLRHDAKWGYLRYHPDANGNVKFLLDNDGAVREKYTYDVFGRPKIMGPEGEERTFSHWKNRFLFQGREYIEELGVYDYRNRFYHPDLGRFLQVDPTGFDAGDMNLFRYCGDDPIDGSDPTGLHVRFNLTSAGYGDWIKSGIIPFRDKQLIDTARVVDKIMSDIENFIASRRPDGASVSTREIARAVFDDAREAAKQTADTFRAGKGINSGRERVYARYIDGESLERRGPTLSRATSKGHDGDIPGYVEGGRFPLTVSHSHGPGSGPSFERRDIPSANGANFAGKPFISSVGWYQDRGEIIRVYVPGGSQYRTTDGISFAEIR